jgi:hypothetical protein
MPESSPSVLVKIRIGTNMPTLQKLFRAEYLILKAALPRTRIQNVAILLFDATANQLHCRYRPDWKDLTGEDADVLELLAGHISNRTKQLGAEECLTWMESTFSNAVRLSRRKRISVRNYQSALNSLYKKYIPAPDSKVSTPTPYSITPGTHPRCQ